MLWPVLACSGEKVLGDYPPCSCDLAEPPAHPRNVPLKIATFWEEQEQAALRTMTKPVDDSRRYSVATESMASRDAVQHHISEAFVTRDFPDVFQVNGGSDVLRWVDGRPPDATDVCALDGLHETSEWKKDYFSEALDPLTCNGHLYGVPVGIHHVNVLLYNRELFEQLNEAAHERGEELVQPEDLKDVAGLVKLLAQVGELPAPNGSKVVPLALGSANSWPLSIVAFENVLLSLTDDAYETLWMGGLEGEGSTLAAELRAHLQKMLRLLGQLLEQSNFMQGVTWEEAVQQVGRGEALLTINGDWAFAAVPEEHQAHVEIATFPGTSRKFAYTPDSFAAPRDFKKNGFPARFFLRDVAGDRSALLKFANVKHAIPPHRDLPASDLMQLSHRSLRASYDEFTRCTKPGSGCRAVLAVSGLAPPPGSDPCFDEIEALLRFAVTKIEPEHDPEESRLCRAWRFPTDSASAERQLLELLLEIGERRFAKACR